MFFFARLGFCREPLVCCWHCGAKLCDQQCFQAHVLVCSLRTLPREAVVTYLEPVPAMFTETCARRGVVSVAHPPGCFAQRDLRADGRLPPSPLSKIFGVLVCGKCGFRSQSWFEWVQDIEVSRAAPHSFFGRSSCHESGFAAGRSGNGCTLCLRSYQRQTLGRFLAASKQTLASTNSFSKRSIEASWCGALCAPLTAKVIFSNTFVFLHTCGSAAREAFGHWTHKPDRLVSYF